MGKGFQLKSGLDRLLNEPALLDLIKGRVGYLCHSASVDSRARHGVGGLKEPTYPKAGVPPDLSSSLVTRNLMLTDLLVFLRIAFGKNYPIQEPSYAPLLSDPPSKNTPKNSAMDSRFMSSIPLPFAPGPSDKPYFRLCKPSWVQPLNGVSPLLNTSLTACP